MTRRFCEKAFMLKTTKQTAVMTMAKRKVDGLSFKAGPTQSGLISSPPPTTPPPTVGGEIIDVNTLAVLLSRYWLLILVLLIPLALVFYKKRTAIPKWFIRLMYQIKGY
jgi:hypothetical protein